MTETATLADPSPGLFAGWGGWTWGTLLFFAAVDALLLGATALSPPDESPLVWIFLNCFLVGQNLAAAVWGYAGRQGPWRARAGLAYLTALAIGAVAVGHQAWLFPVDFSLDLLLLHLGTFLSATTMTLAIGSLLRWSLSQQQSTGSFFAIPRFGIKHLLLAMSVCAVVGALARSAAEILIGICAMGIFLALYGTLAGQLLVARRPTLGKVALVIGAVLALPLLMIIAISLGNATSLVLLAVPAVLLLALLVGLLVPQLDRRRPTAPSPAVDDSPAPPVPAAAPAPEPAAPTAGIDFRV